MTAYLEAAVKRLGVDVWLDAEATADGLLELGPDAIIVATGSQPDLPSHRRGAADPDAGTIARSRGLQVSNPLHGLDSAHVRSVDDVMAAPPGPGSRVLVDRRPRPLGGGWNRGVPC